MGKGIRKTGDIAPLGVRMPPELKDALAAAARQNGRSLNAEIVLRLQQSLEPAPPDIACEPRGGYAVERRLSALEADLLDVFGKLPETKRYALIALFK